MSILKTYRMSLCTLIVGILLSVCFSSLAANSQLPKVEFTATFAPVDSRAGEGAQVLLTAKIPAGYHMYSLTEDPGGGVPLKLELKGMNALTVGGKPVGSPFTKVAEPILKLTLEEYTNSATFGVPVMVKAGAKGSLKAAVHVQYQICNERHCLPPTQIDVPITFNVAAGTARINRKKPVNTLPKVGKKTVLVVPANPSAFILTGGPPDTPPARSVNGSGGSVEHSQSQGLLPFLFGAIAAGFASLLTPCVFPMIPITVSFFTKRKSAVIENESESEKRAREKAQNVHGVRGAIVYCIGIIGTFTGLGLLTTILFGATGIQNLAANPWVNLALGALFVLLAFNLMGAFEIILPTWLLNSTQGTQAKGGLIAPLLMGLTFTLTSFTCTSPFVGTVLLAAAHGHYLYPFIGMLGFSTAFALPFFLLALFPQTLSKIPKSGSWLVTVKSFMGFLELAAALKFFSSSDLTWGQGVLTRPIFLAIWSCISVIAGLYLLGWLRLPHEDRARVGIFRKVVGIVSVFAGIYCLAGIEGKSLGDLEAFVPPTPYPYANKARALKQAIPTDLGTPKKPFKNFEDAVVLAKQQNKPIFIDFTGYSCVNCRLMERSTLIHPDVLAELKNYIYVELYTDRGDAENNANQKLEQQLAKTVALPVYVAVTPDGKTVVAQSEGYTRDVAEYVRFLRKGQGK